MDITYIKTFSRKIFRLLLVCIFLNIYCMFCFNKQVHILSWFWIFLVLSFTLRWRLISSLFVFFLAPLRVGFSQWFGIFGGFFCVCFCFCFFAFTCNTKKLCNGLYFFPYFFFFQKFFAYILSFVTRYACGQDWTAFIEYDGKCFHQGYFYCEIWYVQAWKNSSGRTKWTGEQNLKYI